MDIRRKLNGILALIEETAQAEADALNSETERRRAAALESFENTLLSEVYGHIRAKTSQIRVEAGSRVSAEMQANGRELYRARREATDALLARVRLRVLEFASSADYPAALKKIAARAARELAGEDLVVYLRECDLALSGSLGIQAEFKAGDIQLGGLVAQSVTRRLRIDLTYDAAMDKAKREFRAVSGSEI